MQSKRHPPGIRGDRIVIVGGGIAGLSAAIALSATNAAIVLLEKAEAPGGKMRTVEVAGEAIDAGPTVFTMRAVFDQLLQSVDATIDDHIKLRRAECLARHAWLDGSRLDLFADVGKSAAAIEAFSDRHNADEYRWFCADSAAIFETLKPTLIAAERPNPLTLARRIGLRRFGRMMQLRPFTTLWGALGDYFSDPRLRQLFGRYATYCGASPFAAPATLMLVSHVEQTGVWLVEGGMHALAKALAELATQHGVEIRYGADVARITGSRSGADGVELASGESIKADAVIYCGDVAALPWDLADTLDSRVPIVPPSQRSLSALTWSILARTDGFPLAHHTVFFSDDYRAEFDTIFKDRRVPDRPTIYVCAQDRDDAGAFTNPPRDGRERLLLLINAPADGDLNHTRKDGTDEWLEKVLLQLNRYGLVLDKATMSAQPTTPSDFNRLYPRTGGALYGRALHGWATTFQRPGARTRVPGLYLAGGSVHPGPGVPMAAISGRLAAAALMSDRALTPRSRPVAIAGGMSMA